MKKRIYVFLVILYLLCLSGCENMGVQEKVRITVITKATETDFWRAVKNGCNAAASEYNVDLVFQGPSNEEDYETQNRMIEEAVDQGTKAIVLSAIDRERSLAVLEKAVLKGIYIVIIDSGIDSDIPEVIISTDNYSSGESAAKAMLLGESGPLKIGIVNFAQGTANGQEREQGFIDTILEDGTAEIIGKVSVDSNLESAENGTKQLLEQYPELNAMIAFNEYTTLGMGSAIAKSGLSETIKVIGFDNNNTAIELLEDGFIDGLLVQNQFAIGYLGVECAYNLIADKPVTEREIYMDVTLVERENLFEEGIQKIVFPVDNSHL